jgi:hypothetical protein
MEIFMACGLAFLAGGQIEWEDGENVLHSLLEEEYRPAPGVAVSNAENTLRAVSRPAGIELIYNKFPVELPGEIPFVVITGEVLLRFEERDSETVFFDGNAEFEGLPSVSRIRLRQCFLTSEFPDGEAGGSILIDGQEFRFFDIVSFIKEML